RCKARIHFHAACEKNNDFFTVDAGIRSSSLDEPACGIREHSRVARCPLATLKADCLVVVVPWPLLVTAKWVAEYFAIERVGAQRNRSAVPGLRHRRMQCRFVGRENL